MGVSKETAYAALDDLILKAEEARTDHWKQGGRFANIRILPNTNRGNLAEDFLVWLGEKMGMPHERSQSRRGQWDVRIDGIELEAKFATEDSSGNFQFNGIRLDTKYDLLFCMGVSPNDLYVGLWRRSELLNLNLVSMAKGTNSAFKLTRNSRQLYTANEWLDLWEQVAVRNRSGEKVL